MKNLFVKLALSFKKIAKSLFWFMIKRPFLNFPISRLAKLKKKHFAQANLRAPNEQKHKGFKGRVMLVIKNYLKVTAKTQARFS